MNSLEQQYYEVENFWEEEALSDPGNNERIQKTATLVPQAVRSFLDAGCGNGIFLKHLHQVRPDIKTLGVDRSEAALRHVPGEKFQSGIDQINLPDRSFECVGCMEVLEHLPIPIYEKSLSELARLSDKYLLISVPFDEDLALQMTTCPSCKTTFHSDLHFRSYSKENFQTLFQGYGFSLKEMRLLGASRTYKYHHLYRKLFFPSQFKRWLSPLCPLCGYEAPRENAPSVESTMQAKPSRGLLVSLKSIPKMIWPKETKYYWILGLFERQNA